MKRLSIWLTSILIVSALLLNGARSAHAQLPGPRETPNQTNRADFSEHYTNRNYQRTQLHIAPPVVKNQISPITSQQPTATHTAEAENEKYAEAVAWSSGVQAFCAVLLVGITALLWWANQGMNNATQQAAEAARQSARAAQLALNAERPYLFVEEQRVGMYLRVTLKSLADVTGEPKPTPDVSMDPISFKGRDESNRADVRLDFNLKNRGKGVAILRSIRIRMLVGRGIDEQGPIRLTTIGWDYGTVQHGVRVLGSSEAAGCFSMGLNLPLELLSRVTDFRLSLRFAFLVTYSDVYGRRFYAPFPFEYRGPVRNIFPNVPDFTLGPMLVPAFNKRRRYP